jgi:abequosyltransferase
MLSPVCLLTIAIPTFNRATFLQLCLANLVPQVKEFGNEVELLVSDNASSDATVEVVRRYASTLPSLRAVRNRENIGSDRNIAQCYGLANGKYVLIFGDDDVLLPGALRRLAPILRGADHGVVFMKAYGYDRDYLRERPLATAGRARVYSDPQRFARDVNVNCSFISANIVNRSLIGARDPGTFVGTHLVQVYLFFLASLGASSNVYLSGYWVAAKRNNSGGYDYLHVFASNFNAALDHFSGAGLSAETRRAIKRTIVFRHLPYYVLRMRTEGGEALDMRAAERTLHEQYADTPSYRVYLLPILRLPLALAKAWTWALVLAARVSAGEIGRVLSFALAAIRSR